jgi:hypothetical protein
MATISLARTFDLPVLAFEGGAAPRALADGAGKRQHEAIDKEFIIEVATHRAADPEFCVLWSALVAEGRSTQKIYQMPAYFHFQRESRTAKETMELLTITRRSDSSRVGVVPVRLGNEQISFRLGKYTLYKTSVGMINLLGSVPAAPEGDAMAHYLVQQLLVLFPRAKAVFMHSLPQQSEHWAALSAPSLGGRALASSPLAQWRDCHTLPLPETFDD